MGEFKKFLEMTLSFNSMSAPQFPDFSNAEYVGDIENYKVLYKDNWYAITENKTQICFALFDSKSQPNELRIIYTPIEYRGKNLAKKLLLFIKGSLKRPFIFGDAQSLDGRNLVRSLDKSKIFKIFWYNIKTGEKKDYDYKKDNDESENEFRSIFDSTDWRILIEASQNGQPQFLTGLDEWKKNIIWFV